jgi:hypothetical protein
MTNLKLYKELVDIKLKDWRIITTPLKLTEIAEMLNKNDFVVLWDVGFWKYEVKTFEAFTATEIDNFIYSQPKEVAKELENIVNERKIKGFKINWTEHLWTIYQERFINN